ncbi:kelch-like protein 2 [Physella acuta]|uniref:kelch-like protein 2 n=1 Tax=Physella acuta TaxID=109671 RepID=UPI0027DCA60F|nr:kelch-like protein 2 [Physella acuta]
MNAQEIICRKIFNCLTDKILVDYVVKIEDENFECHRLMLAACSEFFNALFRSGMKEANENFCVLNYFSGEVFRTILNALYTGEIVLTLENLCEIWKAVNMLQIGFLVERCEDFAFDAITMDTWEDIYIYAKLLCSEKVINQLQIFMLKNFEEIRRSTVFLQLSFNEVKDLIKSQDLVAIKEDLVLESVIQWVDYSPDIGSDNNSSIDELKKVVSKSGTQNEYKFTQLDLDKIISNEPISHCVTKHSTRSEKLTKLLKQVRTYLVSPAVLVHVYKMELLSHDTASKDLILNALKSHVQVYRHGQWPTAAIHRSCSGYVQAGVIFSSYEGFCVLTADEEEWYYISKCEYLKKNVQLVSFNGELYATGRKAAVPSEPCKMFAFCCNSWYELKEMPSYNLLLVSHGEFIYIINKDDQAICNINPKDSSPCIKHVAEFPERLHVTHALVIDNFLLLFCSKSEGSIIQTSVYLFDILSKAWTRLESIDGPAKYLISFRKDQHNYIIQRNGSIWLLHSSEDRKIEFKFLKKLCNFELVLYGALTYKRKLILNGLHPKDVPVGVLQTDDDDEEDQTDDDSISGEIPGHFKTVGLVGNGGKCSNFIPITIPAIYLSEDTWT